MLLENYLLAKVSDDNGSRVNKYSFTLIIFSSVLQPGIDSLCDPDTINQQLVLHLHRKQMMKKDYAYAASYEDFVSLIEDCDDLEELRQIR